MSDTSVANLVTTIDIDHPLSIQNRNYSFVFGEGLKFVSALQLFVYLKAIFFKDFEIIPEILTTAQTNCLLYLSHRIKNFDEDLWSVQRSIVMKEAIKQWIYQNIPLKQLLLRCADKVPEYISGKDKYWSIYGDNVLGKLYKSLHTDLVRVLQTRSANPKLLSWEVKNSTEAPLNYFSPEIDGDWDHFLGRRICSMLEVSKVPKDGVVVEVGPGSVSKVGFALERFDFKGKIILVEPEESALRAVSAVYQNILNPEVIIDKFQGLFEHLTVQPVNLIIGNHVIDDMIAGKWIATTGYATEGFFDDHYETPLPDVTAYIWECIAKDVTLRLKIFDEIRQEFSKWNPDVWILSVYDSYYFRSNRNRYQSLHHANILSRRLMTLIHKDFVGRGYTSIVPTEYVQSESYWKIYIKS